MMKNQTICIHPLGEHHHLPFIEHRGEYEAARVDEAGVDAAGQDERRLGGAWVVVRWVDAPRHRSERSAWAKDTPRVCSTRNCAGVTETPRVACVSGEVARGTHTSEGEVGFT